jgi:hypothetical protein
MNNPHFVLFYCNRETYDLWALIISINLYMQKGILESFEHCWRRLTLSRLLKPQGEPFLSRASVTGFAQMLTRGRDLHDLKADIDASLVSSFG